MNSQYFFWDSLLFLSFSPLLFFSSSYNKVQGSSLSQINLYFLLGEKGFMVLVFFNLICLWGSWLPLQVYPSLIFSLSFCLWGSAMLSWFSSNSNTFFSHHTPAGLSFFMGPTMSLVEIMSTLMRPMILGLRLIANIMGGHLLTELIWDMVNSSQALFFLCLYESFVCLIQSVIFSLLAMDYYSEVSS